MNPKRAAKRLVAVAAAVCISLCSVLMLPLRPMAAEMVDVGNAYVNNVLNTAASFEGCTAADFGFTPKWNGYFIRHVAQTGGLGDLFPLMEECANGARLLAAMPSVGGSSVVFYEDMREVVGKSGVALGNKASFEVRPGDIAVLRTSYDSAGEECISRYAHLGIVYSVTETEITLVSGNWNGAVAVGTAFSRTGTTEYDTYFYSVAGYARPDYPFTVAELEFHFNANGGVIEGQDHVISYYKIISPNGLNMRRGPTTGYAVIGTIPYGTEFVVETTSASASYLWGYTTCGTKTGWLVISRDDWTERIGLDATDYYLDGDGLVYDRLPETLTEKKFPCGTTDPNGVPSASDLGITREGLVFAGWSTVPGGSVEIRAGEPITPEQIYPQLINGSHVMTLYAVWQPDPTPKSAALAAGPDDGTESAQTQPADSAPGTTGTDNEENSFPIGAGIAIGAAVLCAVFLPLVALNQKKKEEKQ